MQKDRLVILAGGFREADDYARRQGLNRAEWIYPDSHVALWGLHDVRVVRVGTYHLRTDLHKLEEILRVVGVRSDEEVEL